jgi:putative ABC transport system substrate-binding protein
VRRVGVLIGSDENDPAWKRSLSAFTQALAGLGWIDGRNVRMDLRWAGGDSNRMPGLAQELVGLRPDIIVTMGTTPGTVALRRETPTIPIVFANVADPVASGIVPRLNQPGGNITGFGGNEATLGGKLLELFSEIAPGLKRATIMFNPDLALVSVYMPSFETAARSVKIAPDGRFPCGARRSRFCRGPRRCNRNDEKRLPELASDLVNRKVAVIAVAGGGSGAVLAAKAATTTIPIVFSTGADPVQLGYVASLNRPGGNLTGINDLNSVLTTKRLDLLFGLLPKAIRFAFLINPTSLESESVISEAKAAAIASGRQIEIAQAATARDIDTVFASLADRRIEGLAVHTHPFFNDRRIQLITLAAYHHVPVIYPWREAPEAGGLLFYGTSGTDEYRQVGVYVGRVLRGEKPADLPVIRAAKFELVINLQTARTSRDRCAADAACGS